MLAARLIILLAWFFVLSAAREAQQCLNQDGVCRDDARTVPTQDARETGADKKTLECDLYMAVSSIPNSGWGMYTGRPLENGTVMQPVDLVVQVVDLDRNLEMRELHEDERLPLWLLDEHYWKPKETRAVYEARKIQSILPGFGSLANGHSTLYNIQQEGPLTKLVVPKSEPQAGAYTEYQNETFLATRDIPVGHELLVGYGDRWFETREEWFGSAQPLPSDYKQADRVLNKIHEYCNGSYETKSCKELWHVIRGGGNLLETSCDGKLDLDSCRYMWELLQNKEGNDTSARIIKALPEKLDEVEQAMEVGTARFSTPGVIRSVEWLQEHGWCVDHMKPKESTIAQAGSGAFANRDLPAGTIVAPAPLAHLHRGHMEILFVDKNDNEQVHWRGHQLLLNYLYGHPSTSLLFFPYSSVVNFINHSPEPNVELRWSKGMPHPEWMNMTVDEVLKKNNESGLMMEIVALRDIPKGEEIVMNYGREWETAWEKHVQTWRKPHNSDRYRPAEYFRQNLSVLPTQEDGKALPENVMTVCWVHSEHVELIDAAKREVRWLPSAPIGKLDSAFPCMLLSRTGVNGQDEYTVDLNQQGQIFRVKGIHRRGIEIVDKMYTANQFLRQSFRHYIQLPDDMIPESWRDREKVKEEDSCRLYMAESTIPNSGLGMFAGSSTIKEGRDISFPDINIQAESPDKSHELRRWSNGIFEENAEPYWILDHYFWNPEYAAAKEAKEIQSIVPGVGMLANSVTGKTNARSRRSKRDNSGLHPQTDPGAGASSTYHDMRYVAKNGDIAPGTEIMADYGDTYFQHLEETLGVVVPRSGDYAEADNLLRAVWDAIPDDPKSEEAQKKWNAFMKFVKEDEKLSERVRLALPEDLTLDKVKNVLDVGAGAYSIRNAARSIEWLEEHGRCLDNIKAGASSIPQAGKGAFATRHIAKGDIVAPAPVAQLNRQQMEIYHSDDLEDPHADIWRVGTQLLLNYCYGHKNSTILLYPYSPIVNYINHDHENFNAELHWSTMPYHKREWLKKPVDELVRTPYTGLIMEFVATRDIAPGEEILIDYGDQWEQAWNEYVKSWKPDTAHLFYTPAWGLNDYTRPVRTQTEQAQNPYPPNVFIGCYVGKNQTAVLMDGQVTYYKWQYAKDLYHTTRHVFRCEILDRQNNYPDTADSIRPSNEKYTIRVWRPSEAPRELTGVPRRAIEFFDKEYTSDLFIRSAFRHEIGLPDDMLPPAWNDIGDDGAANT